MTSKSAFQPGHTAVAARVRHALTLVIGLVLFAQASAAERSGFSTELLANVTARYGPDARERMLEWENLILNVRGASEREKLERVNRFFNRMRFVEDLEHWGRTDYWATPMEFLGTRGGDCEDFSIAKYFTLREMGVPEERIRVTYVTSLTLRQGHMVLAYYPGPDDDPLILDNLVDEIEPQAKRRDLRLLYGFNADGVWMAHGREKGRRVGRASRIGPWRAVTARLAREFDLAGNGALMHGTPGS